MRSVERSCNPGSHHTPRPHRDESITELALLAAHHKVTRLCSCRGSLRVGKWIKRVGYEAYERVRAEA